MASVNKRKWKGPNGEEKEAWLVRYVDALGKHRGKTFVRKKEADAFARQVEVELDQKIHVAAGGSVTVKELLDRYEEWCDQRHAEGMRMSDSHRHKIGTMLRVHVRPDLSHHRLTDLTFNDVDAWAMSLSRKPTLSHSTVKQVLHVFKKAVDFGVRRNWVARNIVAEVMKDYRGGKREPIRTFTKEQVRVILADVKARRRNFTERATALIRCYVYLATFCGLRIGEIQGLKVEHIAFDSQMIEVRHSLTDRDKLKEPKTKAGIRDVPMPALVASALHEWLSRYYVPNSRGLVFRLTDGGFMSTQNFHRNYWQSLLARNGLGPDRDGRRFHFHALRHFCASMMIEQGLPLTDIAELLGHSSFDMTLQVYAHSIMASQKRVDVLQGLADSLDPGASNVIALPAPRVRKSRRRGQMLARTGT